MFILKEILRQEQVLAQVRAAFEGERRLHLRRYPIQMHMHDGILRLEGEVEDVVAKKLALRLAAAVAGVEGIVDRLRVAPELPMGDGAMRDRLRDILLREPLFEPCAIGVRIGPQLARCREALREPWSCIEVAVDAGVVTLTGQVPSLAHKRLAGAGGGRHDQHSGDRAGGDPGLVGGRLRPAGERGGQPRPARRAGGRALAGLARPTPGRDR